MKRIDSFQQTQSLYSAAWQHVGPGILIAMMCIVMASAAMLRDQTAVANMAGETSDAGVVFDHGLNHSDWSQSLSISHTVQLTLPLTQLRDSDGRITPNGESLFLLLARRMKSLSLSVMLTASSIDDSRFAALIAAHMIREVPLRSTQLRISLNPTASPRVPAGDSILTVTITRHETPAGDSP